MKPPYFHKTVIFLILFLTIWFIYLFMPVVREEGGIIYDLQQGTSKSAFIQDLSKKGLVKLNWLFSTYVYLHKGSQLKYGEYVFLKGASLSKIWYQVTTGKGLFYHPFTIVPGWSFKQLREELLREPNLQHHIDINDNKILMGLLGSTNHDPEGQFFPETYYYTKGIQDIVILKRAYDLMQKKLSQAWETREKKLPFTNVYQVLIAASLVEKEAYYNEERPVIAGVLINRLNKDMLLQFDPTVIYGLGDRYDGKIHKENLLDNNLYNTYVHKGLPPTPIAMPSMESIDAVLHPYHHNYYYFVSKGDGSHQFSETLQAHNKAVNTGTLSHDNNKNNPLLIKK